MDRKHAIAIIELIEFSDCWNWKGGTDISGYPRIVINGVVYRVGKLLYQKLKGIQITRAYRTCKNVSCVNPEHMRPCKKYEPNSIENPTAQSIIKSLTTD